MQKLTSCHKYGEAQHTDSRIRSPEVSEWACQSMGCICLWKEGKKGCFERLQSLCNMPFRQCEDLEEQGNAYRGHLQVLFTCFSVRYPVSGRDDNRSILQSIYPGMAGKKSVIKN